MTLFLDKSAFKDLVQKVTDAGYGAEIEWARNIKECPNWVHFAEETIWVILNSGMKEQIARIIQKRIFEALHDGRDISTAFGHKGKVAAIKYVIENGDVLFRSWNVTEQPIEFLQTIPFIGKITAWHLAKNLGYDCVKPDRHLIRVAAEHNMSPNELCKWIADENGERLATVDTVIWRACNLGILKPNVQHA